MTEVMHTSIGDAGSHERRADPTVSGIVITDGTRPIVLRGEDEVRGFGVQGLRVEQDA